MFENKVSREEYLNEVNGVRNPRKTSAVRKDNARAKASVQTVPKVSGVQGSGTDELHAGCFEIEIEIHGKVRADIDNIGKGIMDALNGVAYVDDRQCTGINIRKFCLG